MKLRKKGKEKESEGEKKAVLVFLFDTSDKNIERNICNNHKKARKGGRKAFNMDKNMERNPICLKSVEYFS